MQDESTGASLLLHDFAMRGVIPRMLSTEGSPLRGYLNDHLTVSTQQAFPVGRLVASQISLSTIVVRDGAGFVSIDSLPGGLQVLSPFFAEVRHEGATTYLYHADTEVFGLGDTLTEAIDDFKAALAELFDRLASERGNLGPLPARVLEILETKVRRG